MRGQGARTSGGGNNQSGAELLSYLGMYVPSHFAEQRPEVMHAHMERHPLATVVGVTVKGIQANHIPLIFEPTGGTAGTLKGHIARANSLWRDLKGGAEVVAIFQGASHYISPNWYPTKHEHGKVVPTWNYAVVHARGRLTWTQDATWLREFLETLTDRQERQYEFPWRVSDAPESYIQQMLAAIVGFEIGIESLTGNWKVSQNRSKADRAGVVASLNESDDGAAREMAALVAEPEKRVTE
jgi:transcriptional regulator